MRRPLRSKSVDYLYVHHHIALPFCKHDTPVARSMTGTASIIPGICVCVSPNQHLNHRVHFHGTGRVWPCRKRQDSPCGPRASVNALKPVCGSLSSDHCRQVLPIRDFFFVIIAAMEPELTYVHHNRGPHLLSRKRTPWYWPAKLAYSYVVKCVLGVDI